MLLGVLPTGGVPAGSHVDQDDLMEGGELYSSLSGGWITGGPGGFGEGRGGVAAGFLRTSPFTMISMPPNTGSPFEYMRWMRGSGRPYRIVGPNEASRLRRRRWLARTWRHRYQRHND